jgi:hypothetical protein
LYLGGAYFWYCYQDSSKLEHTSILVPVAKRTGHFDLNNTSALQNHVT